MIIYLHLKENEIMNDATNSNNAFFKYIQGRFLCSFCELVDIIALKLINPCSYFNTVETYLMFKFVLYVAAIFLEDFQLIVTLTASLFQQCNLYFTTKRTKNERYFIIIQLDISAFPSRINDICIYFKCKQS